MKTKTNLLGRKSRASGATAVPESAAVKAEKKRRQGKAKTPVAVADEFAPLETGVRPRKEYLAKEGWYDAREEGSMTSTRQAAALRVHLVGRAGSEKALVEAIDVRTGEPVFTDPNSDYKMPDGPKTPTRLAIGDVAMGKSTSMKTTGVLRPLLLGRRSVVVDKKLQGHEGEYAVLARRLGYEPIRLTTDGTGLRINVLDPAIATDGKAGQAGAGQSQLLRAILAEALGRPITEKEGKALRVAHGLAVHSAAERNRIADIRDLVPSLLHPDAAAAELAAVSQGELRTWGLDPAFALERMIEEDLAGLVDGPTDPSVGLVHPLTVFDISALPDEGPAVPIVMAIISSWLSGTLRRGGGFRVPTHFVIEEGWHLMKGNFGEVAQRNTKLARGINLINEFAIHHLSDIPVGSPAMAMCREAGTVRVFRQATTADAEAVLEAYQLPWSLRPALMELPQGCYILWQSGRRPRQVQSVRSAMERELCNTDDVMLSTATMSTLMAELEEAQMAESVG